MAATRQSRLAVGLGRALGEGVWGGVEDVGDLRSALSDGHVEGGVHVDAVHVLLLSDGADLNNCKRTRGEKERRGGGRAEEGRRGGEREGEGGGGEGE